MSYNDDLDEAEFWTIVILIGIGGAVVLSVFLISKVGLLVFLFLFMFGAFLLFVSLSESPNYSVGNVEKKSITMSAKLSNSNSLKYKEAKLKRSKKIVAGRIRKWNSKTPQEYFDTICKKLKGSNIVGALENLGFTPWSQTLDRFTHDFYEQFPLYYLEAKAKELSIKLPRKFKKTEDKTKNEVKKDKIIELLIKKKWRMESEEEAVLNDWESHTIRELKSVLKEKGLPLGGKKSVLIERLDKISERKKKVNVLGLNDFTDKRKELLLQYLSHSIRRVRCAAALEIPNEDEFGVLKMEDFITNPGDQKLFRNALKESLLPSNINEDVRLNHGYLFDSGDSFYDDYSIDSIDDLEFVLSGRESERRTRELNASMLKTVTKQRIESLQKLLDKLAEISFGSNSSKMTFKEWAKDNKGKTFSDYKFEVLDK